MSDWRDRLADVDDEYLIGISNKGIVKRAYKDREETAAEIVGTSEEEGVVKVGGETVTVRFPLGESKCSCPSRSICRHVVQGILALKESCLQGGEDAPENGTLPGSPETSQTDGQKENDVPRQGIPQGKAEIPHEAETDMAQSRQESMPENTAGCTDMPQKSVDVSGQNAVQEQKRTQEHRSPENGPDISHKTAVLQEIGKYPFDKLKKALGNRHFQTFVNQLAADIRPEIQYSSVVTVRLAEPGIVVKLLSPLEYSTCTCHKKELCRHKAAAILWCQLETGTLKKENLLKEAEETPVYDMEQVREAAGQMHTFLEELLDTGLSRVSPDVLDYLERLAIISHDALLAGFEGYFRALADSYDRYLKRKAAFQTKDLMEQVTRLYRRVERLLRAEDGSQVAALAGEFRADYLPVGNLDLIGIAAERFRSQTGYEGETIYFLEEKTKEWYTYTNAKPVFYDNTRRRGGGEKSAFLQGPAPWGLGISLENLLKVRIHLTGAKCDARNRLSSSQETRGEITGEQGLRASDIKSWYYRNFGMLFREQIGKRQEEKPQEQNRVGRGTELVFIQPDSCAKAEFSQTGQLLTLPLYDRAGHELLVEVTYSKEEASTIRYLERISEKKLSCFLGKVSLRDGRLRMYPVDLLDIEEPDSADDAADRSDGKSDSAGENNLTGGAANAEDIADMEDVEDAEDAAEAAEKEIAGEKGTETFSGRRTKYQVMEDIVREVLLLMEDLCQSGFDTVHESTWKDLRKTAQLTEQYGMKYLSGLLGGLADEVEAGRHRMERQTGPIAGLYADIIEYLNLAARKAAYDRGADYYTE